MNADWQSAFFIKYSVPPGKLTLAEVVRELIADLPTRWASSYMGMAGSSARMQLSIILGREANPTTTIWDHQANRVVAAHWQSSPAHGPRDASRMQGFLPGGMTIAGHDKINRGHLRSHGQGGGLDINLFPQHPLVNRRSNTAFRGKTWKEYRAMEDWAAARPGTFVFSRLIYLDDTWVPSALDYGVLKDRSTLEVIRFPN